jgi:recombination protein RecT
MNENPLVKLKETLSSAEVLAVYQQNLPDGKVAKKFANMVWTTVSQNKDLQKCNPNSIVRAAAISASLDLDVDVRGLAYLVPFKGQAVFMMGYKGMMELAYRSAKVKSISAHCIYESEMDKVKVTRTDGRWNVVHPYTFEKPTGEMIAVYATAEIEGMGPQTIVLRKDEVERARNMGKAPNSFAWKDHYEAMAKKTAIRQLAKFLPSSVVEQLSKAAAIDERESYVETEQRTEEYIAQDQGSEVIEAQFEEKDEVPEFMQ